MHRRVFLLATVALSGCATGVRLGEPTVGPAPAAAHEELEPLYRAEAGREAITISVASNGCTQKADFAFYVETRSGAPTLSFARKKVDICKSFAMGRTDLTFTWAELGLSPRAPVFLLNPVVAWTGP